MSRNRRSSKQPQPPRSAAVVSTGTEVVTTAAQLPRPQGVHRIAAMDSDDKIMVSLFTEEQSAEIVRRQQQQLILTSLLRVC
jgi:hypothetical protein